MWYGGVERGVAGDGLRSVGEEALPSSKSVCSILPIAIYGPGLSGSGLYNALGRALWMDLPLARLSLFALSVLRGTSGGATMSTLGGTRTKLRTAPCCTPPCSAHRLLSWGRNYHRPYVTRAPALRSVPRSYAAIMGAPLLGKREKGWGFAARLWPFIALCPPRCPKPSRARVADCGNSFYRCLDATRQPLCVCVHNNQGWVSGVRPRW
jgi:hypothetical protein